MHGAKRGVIAGVLSVVGLVATTPLAHASAVSRLQRQVNSLQSSVQGLRGRVRSLESNYTVVLRNYDTLDKDHKDLAAANLVLTNAFTALAASDANLVGSYNGLLDCLQRTYVGVFPNYLYGRTSSTQGAFDTFASQPAGVGTVGLGSMWMVGLQNSTQCLPYTTLYDPGILPAAALSRPGVAPAR